MKKKLKFDQPKEKEQPLRSEIKFSKTTDEAYDGERLPVRFWTYNDVPPISIEGLELVIPKIDESKIIGTPIITTTVEDSPGLEKLFRKAGFGNFAPPPAKKRKKKKRFHPHKKVSFRQLYHRNPPARKDSAEDKAYYLALAERLWRESLVKKEQVAMLDTKTVAKMVFNALKQIVNDRIT